MNKFERAKQEKDGLDVFPALMRAAEVGWESLDDDDVMRLKWYGLYAHNTKDGHFMLRTKVVQGILTAEQAEVMASITDDFARGIIDCTTRQCFQNHWLTLDEVPEVFSRLERVGMTTSGACGDITRNVVGCTLAGIGHDQILDGHAVAEAIHAYFLDNKLYSNLPRKYKISVTGCREDCARGLINDLALSGAIYEDGTRGFNIRVGGGLSSAPRFSRAIDVFVTPEEAPEVVAEITAIFRDSDENRAKRGKARLKFLVDALGADGFRAELVRRLGHELTPAAPSAPDLRGHDHIGVTPQNDGEHSAVGFCVPVGRLRGDQLHEFVRLAREYATVPEIRLTHQQNVLLPWIPNDRVEALLAEPLARELSPMPPQFMRGLQTCTGKEFCGLAKVHTKVRAAEIARFLDTHVVKNGHGEDFRLHFAGCSSSCAQHQIADVGIEGVLKKVDGEFVEAMDIRIGGRLGPDPRFGDVVLKKVPHWDLDETLLRIFSLYETGHSEGETFRDFAGRTAPEWWTEQLTPEAVEGGMTAEEVVAEAVERFHPRVALACSFQKEETVLLDLLFAAEPSARVFALDTRVLFEETYDYWQAVEARYDTHVEVFASENPPEGLWATDPAACCGIRKVAPLGRALSGLDAWITGMRREQSPTRSDIEEIGWDAKHGLWKFNPLAGWTERDVWAYIADHGLPSHPLHDRGFDSIGCVHCTQAGSGREGRWAGSEKTECGLHV